MSSKVIQLYTHTHTHTHTHTGFPTGTVVKNLPANEGDARDVGLIFGLGWFPGLGNSSPLQHSCIENSTDRRSWWATVHGVTKSQTWLSDWTHAYVYTYILFSLFFSNIDYYKILGIASCIMSCGLSILYITVCIF